MLNVLPPIKSDESVRVDGAEFWVPETREILTLFDQQSKFDLTLYVLQREGELHLSLVFNRDLFDEARMTSLVEEVERILLEGSAQPDQPLDELLIPAQPTRLPYAHSPGFDEGKAAASVAASVPERFAHLSALHPEQPALIGPEGEVSYGELQAQAERLARLVASVPGDPAAAVGVFVPHEPSVVTALMGVLTSGRPYVPLDPNYPEERLAFMVEDSGLDLILTTPALRERAEAILGGRGHVVSVDEEPPADVALPGPPAPDALAYLLYTSGSTGRPKAVMQSHRNLLHQADRYAGVLSLGPGDRLAWLASICFDASLMDIFGGLCSGAALCPIDPQVTDIAQLPEILEAQRLTVLHVTPTVFRTLGRTTRNPSFPTIRAVDLGGEAVRPEDVAFFDEHFPAEAILVNSYGPSEHTLALAHVIDRSLRSTEIPIGRPVGDVEVVLLDEGGEVDPVRGEIALRSDYGALGYWNAPELSARAFIPDPLRPGKTLYRTGDIARRRPDGVYVFLHRADDQLKIRGHRIEPHEVESVLRDHPSVLEVAVHAPAGPDGSLVLTACLAFRPETVPALPDLADWCRKRLPAYMIPTAWVTLDRLPRTPTGKIDRQALPVGQDAPLSSRDYVAPRNAEEEVLAELWREVLGTPSIGVFDDFFELGGHSLSATQVAARTREVLGVELPLRRFFDHPTIAETAEWIRSGQQSADLPPITRVSTNGTAPLSFSQERMWFMQELSAEDTAYNISGAVLLEGELDVERLRAAFERVARRQDALRTRIRTVRGRASQVVLPEPDHLFLVEDLTHVPREERLDRAKEFAADVMNTAYKLAEDPLLRVLVIKLEETTHLLAVGMHHAISDMWSFGILARELADAYNDPGAPAAELPVTYRDFAIWQREWLTGTTLQAQLDYWSQRLAGVSNLELPTDFPRPLFYAFEGRTLRADIPRSLRVAIQRVSVEERATPFMVLLAAFNLLLSAHSRQTDLAVGVPIANRTQTATEGLIGTFVNTLVHRNDLTGDPTFRELVMRVRNTALDAYAHQDVPFEVLVKELDPERDTSRAPFFQVLFNVANVRLDGGEIEGLRRTPVPLPKRAAQFDLSVLVAMNELQSEISFTYNSTLFTQATAERILGHYLEILERVVRSPDSRLSELQAISSSDRKLLLDVWNRTERDYPRDANLPTLLDATAERVPDRVAITSPTGEWTYAQLREAAQRITGALIAMDVQPGDRVGILMERSREMLAALVGILGAGATYVPLDPAYPAERIRYMLEDSEAVALVSHRGLERRFGLDTPVLDLDRWTAPPPAPFQPTRPDQAAYVIYTSGSTGKPKGVEVPHGAMVNFLFSMADEPGLGEQDVLLAVTTISFDIAVLELFLPLLVGARVVIAGEDETADGRRLAERLETEGVTLMQATPATWKLMIAGGWSGKRDLRVLCGGEALPQALADDLLGRVAELWNMYGPTETTVWSTVERVRAGEPILIGRPIANTTLYVLDEAQQLVPVGVSGELWIGGDGVANGYVGRPDLTAERFIDSPFRPGERIYRTGDLVRYCADGRLEHLGRLDHQVKVRGYRIELGEIEARLRAHPGVRDAVVVARDERLVAYLIHELDAPTVGELRTWVADSLPPYMMPSFFVPLESFPLTPNGKVDRKQLPDPGQSTPDTTSFEPPTLPNQRIIAEVWAELLAVERIGLTDNFFELGGHSLLAMEAVALVEERTGHRLDPRSLFFRTLGQLAEALPLTE